MNKPTVQDIFLKFYSEYLEKYTPSAEQSKVSNAIMNCKTSRMGANVQVCEDCGCISIHYNSCRNRCCPMCQALPKEKWMDMRKEDVWIYLHTSHMGIRDELSPSHTHNTFGWRS